MKSKYVIILFISILMGCQQAPKEYPKTDPEAQKIVDELIKVYGGDLYAHAKVEFDFRDKSYGSLRNEGEYVYARVFEEEGKLYQDFLTNYGLIREIDGKEVKLSSRDQGRYSRSVNSVIYFALLPYGLNDEAVIKRYIGENEVEGKSYHKILVTFRQEGGGDDHDDEFVYWIGKEDYSMDYFAYGYHTDGGGTRFRKALNKRTVGGITFQDYINYEGEDRFGSVDDLDDRFQKGELKELSRIELKNIYSSQVPMMTFIRTCSNSLVGISVEFS